MLLRLPLCHEGSLLRATRCSLGEIGGLDDIKRELQEAVEWPMRFPDMYRQLGHAIPKGILLHGPSVGARH